jgi:hypothetical protein
MIDERSNVINLSLDGNDFTILNLIDLPTTILDIWTFAKVGINIYVSKVWGKL